MDSFELDLQRAMRRVEVRAETAAKFLALAAEAEQLRKQAGKGPRLVKLSHGGRVVVFPKATRWFGSIAAALLLVSVFTGERIHQERQRQQAEQQFAAAMRVTDHALDHARTQLEQAGLRLGE